MVCVANRFHITHHPAFNPNSRRFQELRDAFERAHFSDVNRLEEYCQRVSESYLQGHARSFIRSLIALWLNSSGTQFDSAGKIRIDRTALSVARNYGELGSRPLANILILIGEKFYRNAHYRREIGRNGFIDAARETARFIGRIVPPALDMTCVNYELLCGVAASRGSEALELPVPPSLAIEIASSVASTMHIPGWYRRDESKEAKVAIQRLQDPLFAPAHIQALQREWIDILIFTWATIELEGPEEMWQAD